MKSNSAAAPREFKFYEAFRRIHADVDRQPSRPLKGSRLGRLAVVFATSLLVPRIGIWAQTNVFPASGNVGIGTANPSSALEIRGSDDTGQGVARITASADGSTLYSFRNINTNEALFQMYYNGGLRTQIGTDQATFFTGGNLGIGTEIPGALLTLQGGDLRFNLPDSPSASQEIQAWDYNAGTPVKTAAIQFLAGQVSGYGNEGTIVFKTGSISGAVERMRINSDGDIGIGTTSPGEKLDVIGRIRSTGGFGYQTGDGAPWWITGDVNGPAVLFQSHSSLGGPANRRGSLGWMDNNGVKYEYLTWTDAGNIGVGTTTPSQKLNVVGQTLLDAGVPNDSALILRGDQSAIAHQDSSGNTKWLSGLRSDNGGPVGSFAFWNPSVGFMLNLTQDGNVGLGTSSPSVKLDIAGSGGWSGSGGIRLQGNNPGFEITDTISRQRWLIANGVLTANDGKLALAYDINHSRHNIVVDTNGNVGIGTMSPGAKLDVAGSANVQGNLSVAGSFTAPTYSASSGAIAGGSSGLTLSAGGANQNVTITPSGMGATVLNGNVGIGTANPGAALEVDGVGATVSGKFDNIGFLHSPSAGDPGLRLGFDTVTGGGIIAPTENAAGAPLEFWMYNHMTRTWTQPMTIADTGNVGIGTAAPDARFSVKGTIHATEVVVDAAVSARDLKVRPAAWADYVFDDNYQNAPLSEVEREIKAHKHLPDVPSAQEVAKKGINLGQMQAILLRKIEELTLHQIEQERAIRRLSEKVSALEAENAALRSR